MLAVPPKQPQLLSSLTQSHNWVLSLPANTTSLRKAQVSMLMRGHNLYGHLDGTTPSPTITSIAFPNWIRQY